MGADLVRLREKLADFEAYYEWKRQGYDAPEIVARIEARRKAEEAGR